MGIRTADEVARTAPRQAHRRPQQRRSQDACERFIEAGRTLCRHRDFDAVTIRDLAQHAHCSVGSFYFRFGTKEEFFDLLVTEMQDRRAAEIKLVMASESLAGLPAALARGALAHHRAYAGLLRSMVKKHLEGQPQWPRVSLIGQNVIGVFAQRIAAERGQALTDGQINRLSFAFVWLYGLLAQGLLGIPDHFGLEADFFEEQAVSAFERAVTSAIDGH